MISLKEINKDNFWDIIGLSIAEDQLEFLLSNAISIAQSKVQPECIPLAIYNDDQMVGFLMYCIDTDDGEYWIYRFMIDKNHQSHGYGKMAMQQIIELIKADQSHDKIYLGVHKENIPAVRLYESLGFQFTGQVFGNEHIMKLNY